MSEKLDGVRLYFDGAFWLRSGRRLEAPAWFCDGLPAGVHLDGELWAGRGGFTEARVAAQHGRWTRNLSFQVFDAPQAPGTWAQRMAEAAKAVRGAAAAFPVAFRPCKSLAALNRELLRVRALGGEGLVLRHPRALGYLPGRSKHYLKVKHLCAW
jgi:DNA ligase 1